MIMLCVICRLMYTSCIYDRWPIVVHIYQHQTQQKKPERTHHDQASSYKELCKGRATELYKLLLKLRGTKEKLFSTLSSTFFIILCVYHLSCYFVVLMFCSDINQKCNCNNVMLPFPVSTLNSYICIAKQNLQPVSVKSWLKLL